MILKIAADFTDNLTSSILRHHW